MDVNRYYGKTYSDELRNSLAKVSGSICTSKYSSPINKVDVQKKRQALHTSCKTVANTAYDRIEKANKKIESLSTIIQRFYGEVDDSALEIIDVTNDIVAIISESNAALSRLCDILQSAGAYSGKKVTPSSLSSAGLDQDKCDKLRKKAIEKLLNISIEHEHTTLNEDLVTEYLNSIKAKFETDPSYELSEEELEKLNELYKIYVNNRFGDTNDVRDLPLQTIQNLIDIYELLNPTAKENTDYFFDDMTKMGDSAARNVLRAKFTIYTADPEYRDIIIYYLPDLVIGNIADGNGSDYNSILNSLCVDLNENFDEKNPDGTYKEDRPLGSFFHELGHAIDDVSKSWGNSSSGLKASIIEDLTKSMTDELKNWSDTNPYYSLSDKDIEELLKFMFSKRNPNVIPAGGSDDDIKNLLPSEWDEGKKSAYIELLNIYGFRSYSVGPDGSVTQNNDIKGKYLKEGYQYGILADIIGGATNNKVGGCGHGWSLPDNLSVDDLEELCKKLSSYNYWSDNNLETEFFAEMFEYNVMNIDQVPTREIFEGAGKKYDDLIKDLYSKT